METSIPGRKEAMCGGQKQERKRKKSAELELLVHQEGREGEEGLMSSTMKQRNPEVENVT
jgi:hypothetical protein